jgi:hypothetical protein
MKLKRSKTGRQLELPVLVDVNGQATTQSNVDAVSAQHSQRAFSPASEQDLLIYEEIADNYFNSLKGINGCRGYIWGNFILF